MCDLLQDLRLLWSAFSRMETATAGINSHACYISDRFHKADGRALSDRYLDIRPHMSERAVEFVLRGGSPRRIQQASESRREIVGRFPNVWAYLLLARQALPTPSARSPGRATAALCPATMRCWKAWKPMLVEHGWLEVTRR